MKLSESRTLAICERLERILTGNILPYWYPAAVDSQHGGYDLAFGDAGDDLAARKHIVSQSRMLCFFSQLASSPDGNESHAKAAQHGYQFLVERMWDHRHGGFFWEIESNGNEVTAPHKHLYGQAFGIYALSEYSLATGDRKAADLAVVLFDLLEERARDAEYGGYLEFFLRDWSRPDPAILHYMDVTPETKQLNTHLHLLEAIIALRRVRSNTKIDNRLRELIDIMGRAVVREEVGACTDKHGRDWSPFTAAEDLQVTYGHDLENAWFLLDAGHVLSISPRPIFEVSKKLFNHALLHGWDHEQGGFFYKGPLGQPADQLQKIWWVQAEALVASLELSLISGDDLFLKTFESTLAWIEEVQVDWPRGEWHQLVMPDGEIIGPKATNAPGGWKTPYHNGRAIMHCLNRLRSIDADRPEPSRDVEVIRRGETS